MDPNSRLLFFGAEPADPPLFTFTVGTSFTFRPRRWGNYGMSSGDWFTNFLSYGVPWASLQGTALSYVTHPQENARSNPEPGVIWGVEGFPTGVYEFELRGGAGADADPGFGAPGGLGVGRITITPSDVIYFAVGQGGIYTGGADRNQHGVWFPNPGGWNGGGDAGAQGSSSMFSGSGGGGTDIRLNGTDLSDRIMVVGGGGGSTDQNYNTGGYGGGFNQNGQAGGFQAGPSSLSNAGQGGTLSGGGSGARKGGTLYQSYMNGGLWFGGNGFDESSPAVNNANAAGGGGGGYYGGGGAVDEGQPQAGGAGGGSGYADTSIVTVISSSGGGANNGHPSWTNGASSVNSNGKTSFTDFDGSTFDPGDTASNNAKYLNWRSGARKDINRRYGQNGSIKITRIS